jgi:uncharacterized BrkB/YihY/UPF0761 family membrane protein
MLARERVPRPFRRLYDLYMWWRSVYRPILRRFDSRGQRLAAGSIAYHGLLGTIAVLTVATAVLFVVGSDVTQPPLKDLVELLPADAADIVAHRLQNVDQAVERASAVIVAASIFAIYGLTSGFASVRDGLNRVFGVYEYETFVRRYLRAAISASIFVVLIATSLLGLLLGSEFAESTLEWLGVSWAAAPILQVLKWCGGTLFAILAFATVYRWASRDRPSWRFVIIAATVTACLWLAFTLLFAAVIEQVGLYRGYGTLASVLSLQLYVYWSAWGLLYIAGLRDEIERAADWGLGWLQIRRRSSAK